MKTSVAVLSLALNHGVHEKSALYRLKRGTKVHLVPGASLLGRKVALYCNCPNNNDDFKRKEYSTLIWHSRNGEQLSSQSNPFVEIRDLETFCEIETNRGGSFHFYFIYEDSKCNSPEGSLYVQVEPIISVGPKGSPKVIPLDSIRCQTVLAKCLGPLSTWELKLRVAKESGYNVIHFTPIQELGGSRSCYSIQDQLKVNSDFANPTTKQPVSFDDVAKVIQKCRQEWGIASICDIVLNHTANESKWLVEHPECTYSCFTCPHLRPAFLLDALLAQVGRDVADGFLETVGVPIIIEREDHLIALRYQIQTKYLCKVNLHEFYQCNIDEIIAKFLEEVRKRPPPNNQNTSDRTSEIVLLQDHEYRRLKTTIDLELALEIFNNFRPDCYDEDTRVRKCAENLRARLEFLNESVGREIRDHLNYAIENCLAGTRYERVQEGGPYVKDISIKHPVFHQYFTHTGMEGKSLDYIEKAMYTNEGHFFMAHNGWVMNADPLKDFGRPQPGTANIYLCRELIAWGDSVKLRFGDKPSDCPYLWEHMKQYVETTARIFDGVRLDNCHSTPLHVAEYLLDCARAVNPELYVVAELFTNSDATDNIFVNLLGITSLIREAQAAWDSHEEGRLVYRYGGAPVGAFFSSPKRKLASGIAHALFLDLTHDNPSPIEKRSVYDLLPSAALVSMACCATGSNRGYDELVPHHIHVVDEERQYQEWGKPVDSKTGIIGAKRALNLLHGELAEQGFSQVFVDQMDSNIVAVTRHSPKTHQSVILVAHTAFGYPDPNAGPSAVKPLRFEGNLEEIILEAEIYNSRGNPFDRPCKHEKDSTYINGIKGFICNVNEHIPLTQSKIFKHTSSKDGNITQLDFENLRPGSVIAIRVSLHDNTRPYLMELKELVSAFHEETGPKLSELEAITSKMNLLDLNKAIYRCDQEDRDMGKGVGCYDIPGFGPLVYCGLQGFTSLLGVIAPNNDLGHPFCDNLRQGNWMIDYVHERLAKYDGTVELGKWFAKNFIPLKEMPRYLIPSYFDVIISGVHAILIKQCFNLMSKFVQDGSNFIKRLSLGSVQVMALCESADLPKLSPNTKEPKSPSRCATLSAGLPHFSTGYMRCWGRDTFISIRGLLILCGRYDEARYMILGFGSCLRHGLIPNLLDSGSKPRFNCRDAVWWWLYNIAQYVEEAPNGSEILSEKVSRLFPTDDSEAKPAGECDQFLYDVIQEAMNVHFQGLIYRERNAGKDIDAHMIEKGFNNQIGIHPETGFVFGGNDANCGTWMDKMGSSDKAGNRGRPTTPRDGSAVELVGLLTSCLRFLQKMNDNGVYPYKCVERTSKDGIKATWTFKEWADRIVHNFEKHFFVGNEKEPLINKHGIYKDTVGATQPWCDYQLRCNFPIAMVAAPELFNPKHAWEALEQAKKYILGPLGMKTLDPDDWAYNGDYDNSNDSDNPQVAHGANYHQGPEWLWPIGYYLRARLIFARENGFLKETIAETWSVLTAHLNEIQTSPWRGLAELTNKNGAYCKDSCRTQAWSMATVLEVLHDLKKLE